MEMMMVAPRPIDEGGDDLLSLLPDCLLESIVSLLPPNAACRTTALSRRWRSVWPNHPLHLDVDDARGDPRGVRPRRRPPLARRRLHRLHPLLAPGPHPPLPRAAAGCYDYITGGFRPVLPRAMTLQLRHLRRLELRCCRLAVAGDGDGDGDGEALFFPRLERLELARVEIPEAALHRLLDGGCPALRELNLDEIDGLRRIALRSRTLAAADIRVRLDGELCVRDTPSLRALTLRGMDLWRLPAMAVDVPASADVCLMLPALGSPTLDWPLPLIKSLILGMEFATGKELKEAARILALFPRLTCLQIWNLGSSKYNDCYRGWPPQGGKIACLNRHLTHVLLRCFCATRGELEFASFLVAQAKCLTSMEMIHSAHWSVKTIESQKHAICRRGIASPEAQFHYTQSNTVEAKRTRLATCMHMVPLI
ncbi:hypothetical protein ACP4OV_014415 [Aristida adscensionis]